MQYSKVAILSAVAGSAVASYNSTVTDIATTVVTITSCEENKCTEIPVTTGLTTVTDVDTIYTTYCPLSTTEAPASSAEESKSTVAAESSAPASSAEESKSTVAAESSEAPSVSSFEAGAGKLQVGAALVGAAALLL
ncbi:Pga59 adhesin-like protein [Candida orthopsilosis Co 90-125]|uniref:Pga59 adhesin-like protein n=1 Tax=Candida orthopsilosis (strain 90-125) TaxID=1136231 RepID=H8X9I8_CANO9|nr:Pga59 adhesin-like protein [Candida orthopsilosis Co 90-125]CCG24654.1 Pga59 adhesin-like protein [Candida orthopsilosis Co 90-125]